MPDQYIEVEWNGVMTRVPVMAYADWVAKVVFPAPDPVFTQMWPPKTTADLAPTKGTSIGPNYYTGEPLLVANSLGEMLMKLEYTSAEITSPDADAEYDRDVRGET